MATIAVEKPVLAVRERDGFLTLDHGECVARGKELHAAYASARPFPHGVYDNFLPIEVLDRVVAEFPPNERGRFDDAHSKLKTGYQLEKIQSAYINSLINALNSHAFLDFLCELTGIPGLIGDPYQLGGGLHETRRGGHLSIHADFNLHNKLKLKRRLNLILFLNRDWDESFGGALELWERDMSRCAAKVLPEIGRAVIFNTDADSFHGHPDPLTCPPERTRRSLALYYYSIEGALDPTLMSRTTDFRPRPGTEDKPDTRMKLRYLIRDLTPPALWRLFAK
jgi:hypothetical protein